MPDEIKNEAEGDKKDQPNYVTKDEFDGALKTTADTILARINGMVEGFRAGQPAPATPTETPINLDDIDNAISEGKGSAAHIAALAERIADKKIAELRKNDVDPLRNFGVASLREVARDRGIEKASLPTYAKQYEKEIDEFMKGMSPDLLTSSDAWRKAANLIIGGHSQEILAAETEKAARKANEQAVESSTRGAAPLVDDDNTPLDATQFTGEEAVRALREKGAANLDEVARRMGYKSAREYLQLKKKIDNYDEDLI